MDTGQLPADVKSLYDLANRLAPSPEVERLDTRWHTEISRAPTDVLVALVSILSSGRGKTSRARKALREAAIAEVERKSSQAIIDTLHSLDSATSTLNRRMLQLTVAGILLAAAQLGIAIFPIVTQAVR